MANPLDTLLQSVRNKLTSTAGSLFNQGKSFVQANPTPAGFIGKQIQPRIESTFNTIGQNAGNYIRGPISPVPPRGIERITQPIKDFGGNLVQDYIQSIPSKLQSTYNITPPGQLQQYLQGQPTARKQIADVGNAGTLALDIATLPYGGGVTRNVARELGQQGLKGAIFQGVKEGAKFGGLYGGLESLFTGQDQKDVKEYIKQVAFSSLSGAGVGGAFGGVLGGVGYGFGKVFKKIQDLTTRTPEVEVQLRNLKGQWVAGNKPVKPKGMPTAQWEFQLKFNKQYGRNPYTPVYPEDLNQAFKIEAEKRIGMQARPKQANMIPEKDVAEGRLSDVGGVGDLADVKNRLMNVGVLTDADRLIVKNAKTAEDLAPVLRKLDGGSLAKFFNSGQGQARNVAQPPTTPQGAMGIGGKVSPPKTSVPVPLSKSPIPSQETLESAGKIKMQQMVASGQLPPETPSLPDIIQRGPIDVKDKVNLFDYLRTPDRVMEKIGLGEESKLLRKKYNDYLDELPVQINKITQWSKEVPPESNQRIFQYLDGKNIQLNKNEARVAGEIKASLQQWADRLKLPQESRISNYITHIFDKELIKKEFDPELAKLLENRIAGSVYDPFTEQRLGKLGYKEDTWAALDAYVKRATRKVHMDEALSVIKENAKKLEQSQFKYVKQYIDRINMRPTEIDNLVDNTIKSIFGYKYGLRPTTQITRNARQAVYRGTLGLNVGSAMKNLTQGANTYARLGEKYTLLGYLKNGIKLASGDDELARVGVLRDEFIQDRTLSATKKFWEKVDKGLFYFFETAEKINRGSAYFGAKAQALDKGMSEKQAIEYALKTVRDTQFTFGSIDTPPVLSSDLAKLLLQFQSFTLKQGEFLGEMASKKDIAGLVRYALASVVMVHTIGKLIGLKYTDFIPSVRVGLPPTLQAPTEITKAILGSPDKYGNIPDTQERLQNVGNTLIPFIPGGVQFKKTIQGLGDVNRGYAQTAKGNVRYPVAQTPSNAVRGGLFGPYNLPEAQQYKKNDISPLSPTQSETFKSAQDRNAYYQEIMDKRGKNRAIDQAKQDVEKTHKDVKIQDVQIYWDEEEQKVRTRTVKEQTIQKLKPKKVKVSKPTFKKTKIKKFASLKVKKAKKIKAPKLKAIKLAKAKKIKVINKPRLNLKPLQQNAV